MSGSQAPSPAPAGSPLVAPEESLAVATLLSAAGGFLDAFTWLGHGGVFANAMSGNIVLLGVFSALGEWARAARHVPPLVAFVAGIYVAHRLRHGAPPVRRRVAMFSLALEIVTLAVVAAAPRDFPDTPIVLAIAFVAALQSSCFAKVEGWGYSSVMTTGNLRRAAEAMFAGAPPILAGNLTGAYRDPQPEEEAKRHEARVFAQVCGAFALGTALGAFATPRLGNAALAVAVAILAAALALCRQRGSVVGLRQAGSGSEGGT